MDFQLKVTKPELGEPAEDGSWVWKVVLGYVWPTLGGLTPIESGWWMSCSNWMSVFGLALMLMCLSHTLSSWSISYWFATGGCFCIASFQYRRFLDGILPGCFSITDRRTSRFLHRRIYLMLYLISHNKIVLVGFLSFMSLQQVDYTSY